MYKDYVFDDGDWNFAEDHRLNATNNDQSAFSSQEVSDRKEDDVPSNKLTSSKNYFSSYLDGKLPLNQTS